MKVAVTGGTGFIGSHVVQALAKRSEVDVTVVSRNAVPLERLPTGVRHVQFDIADATAATYARIGSPDVLIHLAWGGLPNYMSLHHFETELPAQYRFLRALVESGLPSLLVTGTCYEYGMQSGELAEDSPSRPANPYGYAKAALVRQLEFLQSVKGFALTWARLFYVYGSGQAPTSIYSQLRAAVSRGDGAFPMSKGEQLRDFLPVERLSEDLVSLALDCENAGVVNVCSGHPTSIRALVERWLETHGWNIRLELGKYPYPSYEPLAFWGARTKLDRLLATRAAPASHQCP